MIEIVAILSLSTFALLGLWFYAEFQYQRRKTDAMRQLEEARNFLRRRK